MTQAEQLAALFKHNAYANRVHIAMKRTARIVDRVCPAYHVPTNFNPMRDFEDFADVLARVGDNRAKRRALHKSIYPRILERTK